MWKVQTSLCFDEWFAGQDSDIKIEIAGLIKLLELFGPRLGRPHADTLSGSKHVNMKELRGRTADKVLRIAFAFDPDRVAILLVAGNKAGVGQKRFYKQLIESADRLYDAHLTVVAKSATSRRSDAKNKNLGEA